MNIKKISILEKTFENSFDIDRFRKFIQEFFNEPQMLLSTKHTGIWKEYSNYISCYYKVAKYCDEKDNNLIVLAVELKNNESLNRSRSMQRNFISKILDQNNFEAAIVAFYSPLDSNWRLSFVRLDYSFTNKGINLELTPARRYSYLVGENEPNHTAKQQLLPIFENEKSNPTLDDIEKAFSVEKVTKDFFKAYKEKYLDLKEFLQNDKSFVFESKKLGFKVEQFSEQFAKKLMGQLAFLYFLQKKGWIGVKALPKSIAMDEFNSIYKNQDLSHKEILDKIYLKIEPNKKKLVSSKLFNLNEHEELLLLECFINTKYNMPWGTGNKKFLREIFDFCINNTTKNFFNDYLEPFFYEALNKKRSNQYFKLFNCKIPFLNGGLFEPLEGYHWRDTQFEIPNELFSNEKEKGKNADGILDIFDRFNFTINEDEPLEKEIAIDPEMLGKIFENLLEINDRKAKGAFYTPREIVHHMCQESLINYLMDVVHVPYEDIKEFILYGELIKDSDNRKDVGYGKEFTIKQSVLQKINEIDDALKKIKVADPAVGSGAFLLGMLNEIVSLRNNITEYIIKHSSKNSANREYFEKIIRKRRSFYKLKWDTIKNCIFAVDIDASAIDITKLRLWLSVIVDQEINEENQEPHPLPNLDCNILVGNSLIDEYEGIKLFDETILYKCNEQKKNIFNNTINNSVQMSLLLDQSDDMLRDMFELQDRFFDENNEIKKKEIKQQIEKIRDDLIEYKLTKDNNKNALHKYNSMKKLKLKPFFIWQLEFAKVFKENNGFDIVIGNPPYVGEEGHKDLFRSVSCTEFGKRYYKGKMDFWYFFTSKGIELLKENGVINYIAPNNWMTTAGGSKMRAHIAESSTIKRFITFKNFMVFENASQQTMIFILKKCKDKNQYNFEYSEFNDNAFNLMDCSNDFLINKKIGNHFKVYIDRNKCKKGETIQFLNFEISSLVKKIKSIPHILLQNNEITNGIHPHHASVTKKMLSTLENSSVGEGIFVITKKELNNLNISDKEKMILKPYYDSSNIGKYKFDKENTKWIIYTTSDFKDTKKMNEYPNLKQHLDKYVSVITSDNKPYGLHRARKQEFFTNEKIVSLRKCKTPTFMYMKEPTYVTAEYNVIKTNRVDMLYLLGILNSKLVAFWLKYMGKLQGNAYQVDKEPLVNIPIVKTDDKNIKEISELVNTIIKNKNLNIDTIEVEKKLDYIIYKLYNLTEKEILSIENTFLLK